MLSMPGPAARVGDKTVHTGVIGPPKCTTVLIGDKPAARIGDDHLCPLVTPGSPPIPHKGGPISGPGVPSVLIEGQPAATIGDMAICVGPVDSIVEGDLSVLIGTG